MSSVDRGSGRLALDEVVAELQELRLTSGEPSYAELAGRIARIRTLRGVPEAAARVGRTTVYDAFRVGRRRIDLNLVLDIVRALGADESAVGQWRERCLAAQRSARTSREEGPAPATAPDETTVPEPPQVRETGTVSPAGRGLRFVVVLLVACVGLNLLGRLLVDALQLSIYLDMSGTAVAAVLLGPWRGALVGVLTNGLGAIISGVISLPFALVNVAGALVWGYGVHRFRLGRTFLRFLVLNLVVGVVCTAVATPILLLLYGGFTAHNSSDVARTVMTLVPNVTMAVVASNLLLSMLDKVISGYVALAARELFGSSRPPAERA